MTGTWNLSDWNLEPERHEIWSWSDLNLDPERPVTHGRRRRGRGDVRRQDGTGEQRHDGRVEVRAGEEKNPFNSEDSFTEDVLRMRWSVRQQDLFFIFGGSE